MQTTGACPRCGGNMNPAQEGGLNFLKCDYCGHKVQVEVPQQKEVRIEGIPGAPGMTITAKMPGSGIESQWMGMISQMSQQGGNVAQFGQDMTAARQQAIIEQVRASLGDEAAAQVARSMGIAAGSGMAAGQPVIAAPAAVIQQMPGAQAYQGWGQTSTAQTSSLIRRLMLAMIAPVAICLLVAVLLIASPMLLRGASSGNPELLAGPLNRLLAGFGMPPATGFSLLFGGGFLFSGAASLLVAGIGGLRASMARNWPTAEGVVLSAVVYRRGSGSDRGYQPEIKYQYQVGERSYVGNRLAFGSSYYRTDQGDAHKTAARYPEGSAVRVHYKPSQPENSVLEARFVGTVLLTVLGVAFSALGAAGWLFGGLVR